MNTIVSDNPLSEPQTVLLASLAGMLIPASDKHDVPGADDDAIMTDIISTARQHADTLKSGLDTLNDHANKEHGTEFVALNLKQRMAIIEHFQINAPHFIRSVVSITVQCYYQDARVMESLGMEGRAPYPDGFDLPQGDWSLLDPVKDRGEIWRRAE